jgi:hypothetical protein
MASASAHPTRVPSRTTRVLLVPTVRTSPAVRPLPPVQVPPAHLRIRMHRSMATAAALCLPLSSRSPSGLRSLWAGSARCSVSQVLQVVSKVLSPAKTVLCSLDPILPRTIPRMTFFSFFYRCSLFGMHTLLTVYVRTMVSTVWPPSSNSVTTSHYLMQTF